MKDLLDEALCKDFPRLFSNRNCSPMESCFSFGFECGNGWEGIIRQAASRLEKINEGLPEDQWIRAAQIKEKYGTLRFYLHNVNVDVADLAYAITENAELLSESTCETCGALGELRGRGWVYTACDEHTREEDKYGEFVGRDSEGEEG